MAFDSSKFRAALQANRQQTIARAIKAVTDFTYAVVGAAANNAPVGGGIYSPRDPAPGTLAASWSVEQAKEDNGKITAVCGFNTVYAARQHEELEWRHEQGEAKYLENAMKAKAPELMEYLGKVIEG